MSINFDITTSFRARPLAAWKANGTLINDTGSGKTVPWPTHIAGDYALLVAFTESPTADPGADTLTTPAGFTLVGSIMTQVGGGSFFWVRQTVWWCYATGSDMASPVVASSGYGGASSSAQIFTFANCANVAPVKWSPSPLVAGGWLPADHITGVDITNPNDLVVVTSTAFGYSNGLTTTFRNDTINLTEYCDNRVNSTTDGGQRLITAMATGKRSTPGNSGDSTVQWNADHHSLWAINTFLLRSVGDTFDIHCGFPQYPWYPTNPDETHAASMGYGTYTHGWFFDEAASPIVPEFGAENLTEVGTPAYLASAPLGGLDKSCICTALTDYFQYTPPGTTSAFDISSTSDLIIAAVIKAPSMASPSLIAAVDNGTQHWKLIQSGLNITLDVSDGTHTAVSGAATLVADTWSLVIGVMERSSGLVRVATHSFDHVVSTGSIGGGVSSIGDVYTIELPAPLVVGKFFTDANVAAMFFGRGVGAATGMVEHLEWIADYFIDWIKLGGHFEATGASITRAARTEILEGWSVKP